MNEFSGDDGGRAAVRKSGRVARCHRATWRERRLQSCQCFGGRVSARPLVRVDRDKVEPADREHAAASPHREIERVAIDVTRPSAALRLSVARACPDRASREN